MIDAAMVSVIRQKKLDSLAVKHLHVKSLVRLTNLNRIVDALAIAVPILYSVPRLIAKDTPYANAVQIGWEVLAAVLVVATAIKIVYHWEDRTKNHSRLLGENISLVRQADDLLLSTSGVPDTVQLFLRLAERSETADREAIGEPSATEKQFAYREALKELEPSNVSIVCPNCGSSPWKFKAGSCQMCGNTPADKSSSIVQT
jgi:mobilome CxxCx(11)CxxC protein